MVEHSILRNKDLGIIAKKVRSGKHGDGASWVTIGFGNKTFYTIRFELGMRLAYSESNEPKTVTIAPGATAAVFKTGKSMMLIELPEYSVSIGYVSEDNYSITIRHNGTRSTKRDLRDRASLAAHPIRVC